MVDSLTENFGHPIGRATESRIIHIEDSITSASSQQYPMTTVVDICNDTMILFQTTADCALTGSLNTLKLGLSKIVGLGPDNVAATGISAIFRQI